MVDRAIALGSTRPRLVGNGEQGNRLAVDRGKDRRFALFGQAAGLVSEQRVRATPISSERAALPITISRPSTCAVTPRPGCAAKPSAIRASFWRRGLLRIFAKARARKCYDRPGSGNERGKASFAHAGQDEGVGDDRLAFGDGAGFVENHSSQLGSRFQCFTIADIDTALGRLWPVPTMMAVGVARPSARGGR